MRTTIRLDDELLSQAKQAAARTGRTLTQVIEDALREALARRPGAQLKPQRAQLPTFDGSGPLPGVDLDSSAELLDLMDADAGPEADVGADASR
jgi:hypothetical protein